MYFVLYRRRSQVGALTRRQGVKIHAEFASAVLLYSVLLLYIIIVYMCLYHVFCIIGTGGAKPGWRAHQAVRYI